MTGPLLASTLIALTLTACNLLLLAQAARATARPLSIAPLLGPLGLFGFGAGWLATLLLGDQIASLRSGPLAAAPSVMAVIAVAGPAWETLRPLPKDSMRYRLLLLELALGAFGTLWALTGPGGVGSALRIWSGLGVGLLLFGCRAGSLSGDDVSREAARTRLWVLLGAGACGVALLTVSMTRVGRATDPLLLVVLVVQADLLVGVLHRKDRLWLSRSVAYAGITIALTFTAAGLLRALQFQVDLTQIALAVLLAVAMGVVLLGVGERVTDGLEKLFFPERVRVDRQLAQARSDTAAMRQRLERLERLALAGELASRVAHEIKNPLAAVRGYAELLLTDDGHESGAALRQKAARIIKEESDRINDAVTSLLTAARPGPSQPVRQVVALEPLVLSALALVETEPGAGRVRAELRDGPLHVRAEPDALRGALLNLLRNALESCAGKGSVQVTVGLVDGRVRVEVVDEGAGLAPQLGARLFEPFATTKPLGTGLGLVIARSAVEAAGGKLTLTNRTDRIGAVARLELPCVPASAPFSAPVLEPTAEPTPEPAIVNAEIQVEP